MVPWCVCVCVVFAGIRARSGGIDQVGVPGVARTQHTFLGHQRFVCHFIRTPQHNFLWLAVFLHLVALSAFPCNGGRRCSATDAVGRAASWQARKAPSVRGGFRGECHGGHGGTAPGFARAWVSSVLSDQDTNGASAFGRACPERERPR